MSSLWWQAVTYAEFWPRYLRGHRRGATRLIHYIGSLLALAALLAAAILGDWRWLIAAPLLGYGCAWAAHVCIEHNRSQTFGHPLWSLFSDYRMLVLALSGRLGRHLSDAFGSQGQT